MLQVLFCTIKDEQMHLISGLQGAGEMFAAEAGLAMKMACGG